MVVSCLMPWLQGNRPACIFFFPFLFFHTFVDLVVTYILFGYYGDCCSYNYHEDKIRKPISNFASHYTGEMANLAQVCGVTLCGGRGGVVGVMGALCVSG